MKKQSEQTIINVSPHPFKILKDDNIYVVNPHGYEVRAKERVDKVGMMGDTELYWSTYHEHPQGREIIDMLHRKYPGAILLGSTLAAEIYPGEVFAGMTAIGYKDKRIIYSNKFKGFAR